MASFHEDAHRQIVPKWRLAHTSVSAGELAPLAPPAPSPPSSLEDLQNDFRHAPSLSIAADLLSASLALFDTGAAAEAAKFVLSCEHEHNRSLLAIARDVLVSTGDSPAARRDANATSQANSDAIHARLSTLRGRTRDEPRNVIAWLDLARVQESLALHEKSARSMRIALTLAPDNRLVLRSAARLWLHQDERDRAHDLLRQSNRLKGDPWLLASEIAVAQAADRTSGFISHARNILSARRHPRFHLSELAAALATLELASGAVKKAKELLRYSLLEPAPNALDQATWIARNHRDIAMLNIAPANMSTDLPPEAQTWIAIAQQDWATALNHSLAWLQEEPFSRRPAIQASFILTVALGRHAEAVQIAKCGLQANPRDPFLSNNLAFSLIEAGQLDEAEEELDRASCDPLDDRNRAVLCATRGMLAFRRGYSDRGFARYVEAIESLVRIDPALAAAARGFLSLEASRVRRPGAKELLDMAKEQLEQVRRPHVVPIIARITDALRSYDIAHE